MLLITPENIASVMELETIPHSFSELDRLVAEGLPKKALKASVERIGLNLEEKKRLLYRIVPEATYKRRRDRLTPEESERTERLARVYATAEYVWDSDEDARTFLHTSHPLLEGQTPLEISMTELGARRVEELLWKLFYGISA
jgi:putative toxin-antitoxin system antitoxin component (TIGR02293 family)